MKKILLTAASVALLAGYTSAANLVISGHWGESLATYANSDDDNDDNDGISFFDHYLTQSQAVNPFNNVQLSGESALGGGELQFSYSNKKIDMTYLNGWLNFANFLGGPGTLTLRFGRFDAYPIVDVVTDANRGFHYASYAVNPLYSKQTGFDAQVMSLFLAKQGFVRDTAHNARIYASFGRYWDTTKNMEIDRYNVAQDVKAISGYSWFFNDANNAGNAITYSDSYHWNHPAFMVQYALNDDLLFRFTALPGSASDTAGTISHDFYGEKTFTNWNAQVSYKVGDIAKLGLTVKMSDMLSGAYYTGKGQWESAGTDLNVSLAASSDQLVDGLRLYANYSFAGVYMGMYGDYGTKKDLSETYLLNAIDLRGVYDIDEQLAVGLNANISMVSQSEYYKEVNKDADDILGFNVGWSASYALTDILAIDFNTGFRCLDVNNKIGTKKDSTKTDEGDMMAVSGFGIEPSLAFTFNKNCALTIGINVFIQNLNSDVHLNAWQMNSITSAGGTYYPFTTLVTLPLYMFIRL